MTHKKFPDVISVTADLDWRKWSGRVKIELTYKRKGGQDHLDRLIILDT